MKWIDTLIYIIKKEYYVNAQTDQHSRPWRGNWYRERCRRSERAQLGRETGRGCRRRRWPGTSPAAHSIPRPGSSSLARTASSPLPPSKACTASGGQSGGPDRRSAPSSWNLFRRLLIGVRSELNSPEMEWGLGQHSLESRLEIRVRVWRRRGFRGLGAEAQFLLQVSIM